MKWLVAVALLFNSYYCLKGTITCPYEYSGRDVLFAHPTHCTKYLQCDHGQPVERDCPAGLNFNTKINRCDWPWNVICNSTTLNVTTTLETTIQPYTPTNQTESTNSTETVFCGWRWFPWICSYNYSTTTFNPITYNTTVYSVNLNSTTATRNTTIYITSTTLTTNHTSSVRTTNTYNITRNSTTNAVSSTNTTKPVVCGWVWFSWNCTTTSFFTHTTPFQTTTNNVNSNTTTTTGTTTIYNLNTTLAPNHTSSVRTTTFKWGTSTYNITTKGISNSTTNAVGSANTTVFREPLENIAEVDSLSAFQPYN